MDEQNQNLNALPSAGHLKWLKDDGWFRRIKGVVFGLASGLWIGMIVGMILAAQYLLAKGVDISGEGGLGVAIYGGLAGGPAGAVAGAFTAYLTRNNKWSRRFFFLIFILAIFTYFFIRMPPFGVVGTILGY